MTERIYLGDWLYNAGIVGFLNIINGWNTNDYWKLEGDEIKSKDKKKLNFGENYIEIDIEIFNDYAKKYIDYAFNMYGRYSTFKAEVDALKGIYQRENDKNKIISYVKRIFSRFKELEDEEFEFSMKQKVIIKEIEKDINNTLKLIEALEKFFEKNFVKLQKKDINLFLSKIYNKKSFLHKAKSKYDVEEVLVDDFQNPILKMYENQEKEKHDYKCVICGKAAKIQKAKKSNNKKLVTFDTGLAMFYGLSGDALNFHWNIEESIPLCHICEIIYFSSFASFSLLNKVFQFYSDSKDETSFYFVNNNASIKDLLKSNLFFKKAIMNQNIKDNIIANFFTELVSNYTMHNAELRLQNISILEVYSKKQSPRVYFLRLTKEQAKYLSSTEANGILNFISTRYYEIKDKKTYITIELIHLYLQNKLNYSYLYKLTKLYMMSHKRDSQISTNININHLEAVNKFLKGGTLMNDVSGKEMTFFFECGKELAERMRKNKQGNKIPSVVYKLLNSLRIGDKYQFIDTVIRLYMAYLGTTFVNFTRLNDDTKFYPLGYSFINGLLYEEAPKTNRNDSKAENKAENKDGDKATSNA